MSLVDEIKAVRRTVVTDGYDMSLGEVASLYREGELKINPAFQRLFRWDAYQKTRFVESILLGIPVPPIFVFQTDDGKWELVDGLQRLSTIFEFMGILRGEDGELKPPSVLNRTKHLPSLAGIAWQAGKPEGSVGLPPQTQLDVRRARLRVEILKSESDGSAKFELFQRLNTGGAELSEQEVRTCTTVMLNPGFHSWYEELRKLADFKDVLSITETAAQRQKDGELALRFLVYRRVPYVDGVDVHEYLDDALFQLATEEGYPLEAEADCFRRTFRLLNTSLGENAFRRWNGQRFVGPFSQAAFDVIALGVSKNLDDFEALAEPATRLGEKVQQLWQNEEFQKHSRAGVRGTTRLANLLPNAEVWMEP